MSKKRSLTGEQEDGRIQDLRLLARIIARHYLQHPESYPDLGGDPDGEADGADRDDAAVTARSRTGGNPACKEANQ